VGTMTWFMPLVTRGVMPTVLPAEAAAGRPGVDQRVKPVAVVGQAITILPGVVLTDS